MLRKVSGDRAALICGYRGSGGCLLHFAKISCCGDLCCPTLVYDVFLNIITQILGFSLQLGSLKVACPMDSFSSSLNSLSNPLSEQVYIQQPDDELAINIKVKGCVCVYYL